MRLAASLVLLALLAGCAPAPVLRLRPQGPSVTWRQGQPTAASTADSVAVRATFDRTLGAHLLFRVEIENHASERLVVAPESVSIRVRSREGARPRRPRHPIRAIDPEAELALLDRRIASAEASRRTEVLLEGIGAALDVVNDVAQAGSRSAEEAGEDDRADHDRAQERTRSAVDHDERMWELERERAQWAGRMLRRSELHAGESVRGLVAFPAAPFRRLPARRGGPPTHEAGGADARPCVLRLEIRLGARTVTFDYDAERF